MTNYLFFLLVAFYEACFNDLFVVAVSTHGTHTKNIVGTLLEKAKSYEYAVDKVKEKVKYIFNVRGSVDVFLKMASMLYNKPP